LADIAFMLLIFFLVTTTMDTDAGISRMLPPPVPQETDETPPKIKERNVFVVLINKNDQLLVEGKLMRIEDLKEEAKEFIANPARLETLPEFKSEEIPYFGTVDVSKQIISLQNDRGTSYGIYLKAQDELARAYNELRDELGMRKFGKKYDDLEEEQQKAVRSIFPQRISEAEPKNYAGGN
jgi:hypothetical protein